MSKDSPLGASPLTAPLVSLVVSMYKVEQYLPAFLGSLSAQGGSLASAEVLFVDDGSPDDSAVLAQEWLAASGTRGRVLTKQNGGLSSARNLGIEHARGEWISFPDPDDVLTPGYLDAVLDVIGSKAAPAASTVATNIVYLDDETGRERDRHPLRKMFSMGRRLFDLTSEPQSVKLQAATTFYRMDTIRQNGLRFDPRVKPNFEDGAFSALYHLTFAKPAILAVPDARYLYRRRADGSSLVVTSWMKREKYLDLPRYGWLEILKAAHEQLGEAPEWLEHIVLYDISFYFSRDSRVHTPTRFIDAKTASAFLKVLSDVLTLIRPESILAYQVTAMTYEVRMVLFALKGETIPLSPVHVPRIDRAQDLMLIKFYFAGEPPEVQFQTRSGSIEPVHAKNRGIDYFGHTVLYEKIAWLPIANGLTVHLNGSRADVHYGVPEGPAWSVSTSELTEQFALTQGQRVVAGRSSRSRLRHLPRRALRAAHRRAGQLSRLVRGKSERGVHPLDIFAKRMSRLRPIRTRFAKAWTLMDRDVQAQDNAEHLYRWIRANRSDLNAWFVLSTRSTDWRRLKKEGFRLVAHGSFRHKLLLLNTIHLISSHADDYVVNPLNRRRFGPNRWSFTFLQHGVTKDDISRWLNKKPISLIITTGAAEQRGLIADGTPFEFTGHEAKVTGFPRHDALLQKSAALAPEDRDLILVMPTWREYLMTDRVGKGNLRGIRDDFATSEYLRTWYDFLASPSLHETARQQGATIAFVPHPNFDPHTTPDHLPAGVTLLRYSDDDIQNTLSRSRVLVTDYSSIAFEAALLKTPVVYLQFDREQFFAAHPHRPGYFDYPRDGFGPVMPGVDEAVAATRTALAAPSELAPKYARRARDFFAYRDDQSCRRVVDEIELLRKS